MIILLLYVAHFSCIYGVLTWCGGALLRLHSGRVDMFASNLRSGWSKPRCNTKLEHTLQCSRRLFLSLVIISPSPPIHHLVSVFYHQNCLSFASLRLLGFVSKIIQTNSLSVPRFDFIVAQSIFSHTGATMLRAALINLRRVMMSGAGADGNGDSTSTSSSSSATSGPDNPTPTVLLATFVVKGTFAAVKRT